MANPFGMHKPGQGMKTRWVLFGTLVAFFAWGSYALYLVLTRNFNWTAKVTIGNEDIFHSAILAFGVFVVLFFLVWRLVHGRRGATLLIDTDQELKKVEWPTRERVVNSSIVVIICVTLFAILLFAADTLLNQLIKVLNLW